VRRGGPASLTISMAMRSAPRPVRFPDVAPQVVYLKGKF
jgi:hypothetical protein